ncbi:hypothetical protein GCM10010275_42360 [Streptomyces litmocidini]|nr:hypothetical protein GCM10010275_42360 [Streptomyces litmocidini]
MGWFIVSESLVVPFARVKTVRRASGRSPGRAHRPARRPHRGGRPGAPPRGGHGPPGGLRAHAQGRRAPAVRALTVRDEEFRAAEGGPRRAFLHARDEAPLAPDGRCTGVSARVERIRKVLEGAGTVAPVPGDILTAV